MSLASFQSRGLNIHNGCGGEATVTEEADIDWNWDLTGYVCRLNRMPGLSSLTTASREYCLTPEKGGSGVEEGEKSSQWMANVTIFLRKLQIIKLFLLSSHRPRSSRASRNYISDSGFFQVH